MPKAIHTTSYPKDKIKILLLEGLNHSAIDEFKKAGYSNITALSQALDEKELIKAIPDAHILGIRSKTRVTKKVLEAAEKLLGVGCFCIGTNQVDMNAATLAGVAVFNSPYSNTRSVAELVIGNIIMLLRRVPDKNAAAHKGEWMKDSTGCYEIRGKTLGIIGYGHIGSQVSVLAESLGLKVIYYDIAPKLPLGNATPVTLAELLKRADIVTLHVPGGAGTKDLISQSRMRQMKRGVVVINLSRGDVIDLDALKTAIIDGHISGAGIDVFPTEPEAKGEKFRSQLQNLPNVILTPHIGGSTEEAQVNIGADVSVKLVSLLDAGSTMGSLSVPALTLPVQTSTHRLLHIHKNTPGILSEINSILSRMNVNILGQYLKTNEDIGYVVLDIEKKSSSGEVLNALRDVKHTIKARILY